MMRKHFMALALIFLFMTDISHATSATTQRIAQFSNEKVTVWETIVYPHSNQKLAMHRHDNDRVVVALSDGVLKVTNDKGQTHYLNFKKEKAYYLTKDVPHELHTDENMTHHPIKVLVVELKN